MFSDLHTSDRLNKVHEAVAQYYKQTQRSEAEYLWQNHVNVVAQYAEDLSKRFAANVDLVVAGALFHDIADIWLDRDAKDFDTKTYEVVDTVLSSAGYIESEIIFIKNEIIEPHSCYPDNLPATLEGKVMATADALAHLTTNFYLEIREIFPNKKAESIEDFKAWALKKLDRDFNDKIFFHEVKKEHEDRYKELKRIVDNL